jgi:hypothetical protein
MLLSIGISAVCSACAWPASTMTQWALSACPAKGPARPVSLQPPSALPARLQELTEWIRVSPLSLVPVPAATTTMGPISYVFSVLSTARHVKKRAPTA